VQVADPVKPREAPPEPQILKHIAPPIAQAPIVQIDTGDRGNAIVTVPPDQGTGTTAGTATLVPDHAPVAIRATHTIPPHPPVALRMGVEGKVTLRLTVLPDGRVGQADIVASSGRPDLDESVQQWIVGHWTYKPALRDGQARAQPDPGHGDLQPEGCPLTDPRNRPKAGSGQAPNGACPPDTPTL
jgi:protein TonB